MTFFIGVPVCLPGMPGSDTAGDDDDPSPFLDPSDRSIAVISFICEDQLVSPGHKAPTAPAPCRYHCDCRRRVKSAGGCRVHLSPYGPSSSVLPDSVRSLRHSPLFSPAAMLVHLYRRTVPPDSVRSAHGRPVPIRPPASMCGNGCTRSAMVHNVLADHARESPCSANTGSRSTSHGCSLQAVHLGAFFLGEVDFLSYSIVLHSSHVFS